MSQKDPEKGNRSQALFLPTERWPHIMWDTQDLEPAKPGQVKDRGAFPWAKRRPRPSPRHESGAYAQNPLQRPNLHLQPEEADNKTIIALYIHRLLSSLQCFCVL